MDLEATVRFLLLEVAELSAKVSHQGEQITDLQKENQQLRTDIAKLSSFGDLSSSILVEEDIPCFSKFLEINRNSKKRAQDELEREQLRHLYDIFCCIRNLNEIGKQNEKVFVLLNFYYKMVEGVKPREEGSGLLTWWWSSSTQNVTYNDLEEILAAEAQKSELSEEEQEHIRTILSIIAQLKEDEAQKTGAPLQSIINSVKEKICSLLDRSGIEICERLRDLFAKINVPDPVAFLKEHCVPLLGDDLNEGQKDRLVEFADTFVVGNDWVHVSPHGEAWKEPSWFSWTCSRIRNSCQLYGRNKTVDEWLDMADEYKATCGAVKSSLEWIYFGGRLAVDPAGAALSLLW